MGWIKAPTLHGNYTCQNTNSLVMVNIRLSNIPRRGDPFHSIANNVGGWFNDTSNGQELLECNITLDVNPEDSKSLETHQAILRGFVGKLRR